MNTLYSRGGPARRHPAQGLSKERKGFNGFAFLLGFFAFSFPVFSLIEASDATSNAVSLSWFVVPSLISIALLSFYSFFAINARDRLLFIAIIFASFFYSAVTVYGMAIYSPDKVTSYFATLVIFGCLVFLAARVQSVREQLDLIFVMGGVLALALLILNPSEYDAGRVTYGDSNPIWMGRILGAGALGGLAAAIGRDKGRIIYAGLFAMLALSVLITGSRGPFLAIFAAAGAVLAVKQFKYKYKMAAVAVYGGVFLGIVLLGFMGDSLRVLSIGGAADESYIHRSNMITYSIDMIRANRNGFGVGQFFYIGFVYPHNILLECLFEWGWVYGAAFALFIIIGVIGTLFVESEYLIIPLLAVFDLINALVSGDMTSPRLLYGLCLYGWFVLIQKLVDRRRKSSAAPRRLPA